MKNNELKEYVNSFPDDAPVSIICAKPRKRKLYKLEDVIWVTDQGQPLILIDIGEESDMDAEMVEACEECEQVRRCGNAVCPPIPAALVRANLPELCVAERMPNMKIESEQTGQLRFA